MPHSRFIQRVGFFLLAGGVLLLAGCATYSEDARTAMSKLKAGNTEAALKWSEKIKKSRLSHDLGYVESGRIKMLAGDFAGSLGEFETAIDHVIEETENGPVIRVGSVGSTLMASTFADDTIRKYELPAYEVIQLLHYQTLNYLLLGDVAGAAVEMRRTVFAQDALAEKYSEEVQENQSDADDVQADALMKVNTKLSDMGPALERTRSSHENGLAWYLCGLIFEKEGDEANAAISYRKAWELVPKNSCIQRDFLRLLQSQDPASFADLVVQNQTDVPGLKRGATEIVVVYEESLISRRIAEKILLPIPDFNGGITLISIDFPCYYDSAYTLYPQNIRVNDAPVGVAEPAVYLQSLAYRDLKDKVPGIVVRNVTRALTKVGAQQFTNHEHDLIRFGMMAVNAASSAMATSDTRAWYSIPMGTRLYRENVASGALTLECRSPINGKTLTIPVTVSEGETRLIWIADTGGLVMAATASLSEKGLPPTVHRFNNPW